MKSGAMDSIKMYYQDKKTAVYYSAHTGAAPYGRIVYDLTYKYAKGTLTASDINIARGDVSLLGDVNVDGKIDKYDYIFVKRICMNTVNADTLVKERSDVNKNGAPDKYDYILIKRHVMGTYKIA